MFVLSEQLLNLDLKQLLEILEVDNDIENVLIILQMYEINTMADLEKIKAELKKMQKEKEDEEDDLLNDAKEEEKKKEELKKKLEQKKEKSNQIHDIINSIISKPMDFWSSNKPDSFANSLLGTIIIPDTKEKRSATAGGILFGLAKSKNKEIASIKDNSRQGLIAKLKEMQLSRAKAHEKIFN